MDQHRQAELERFGFRRTYTGPKLSGEVIWWKRTGSSMDIVRQLDGATKHQDLGEGHPGIPEDTAKANRQWAIELVDDEYAIWHGGLTILNES